MDGGGGGMFTADSEMVGFLIDGVFVQFGGVFSVGWLGFQWGPIVLHCLLTFSFTHMRTNFWAV